MIIKKFLTINLVLLLVSANSIDLYWEEDDETGAVYNVDAVLGRSATLPCNIEPDGREDRVYMVLWFRENLPKPMYSFDVRGRAFTKALHWSDPNVFGPRAYFVTISKPSTLNLDSVQLDDEGIYRCRVDFKNSPSRSVQINLTVIVPPHQLLIYDNSGRDVTGIIGPLDENSDLILICEVRGGRPEPTVSWFVNDKIKEGQLDVIGHHVLVNRLEVARVKREHLNYTYRCQASNTKLMMPVEKSVRLELLLKPLIVRITHKPKIIEAYTELKMVCEISGSRPTAAISWFQDNHRFLRGKVEELNNETVIQSVLNFTPNPDDDATAIKCSGENPLIPNSYLEDIHQLNIVYSPSVVLKLGSTLNPNDIKEGDDVYFECKIRSNPKHHKITWYHNDVIVYQNVTLGVIISSHSLVLQRILKNQSGSYKCQAANSKGESFSDPVYLQVKYAPVCSTSEVITVGATLDDILKVKCYVNANPLDLRFFWQFNNSVENFDISNARFSPNDSHNNNQLSLSSNSVITSNVFNDNLSHLNVSELIYTPATKRDFGTLSCWALNSIGRQIKPCFFHVIPAVRPSPLKNCTLRTIRNINNDALEIECEAGFDGGLAQTFFMEVHESDTTVLRLNLTNLPNNQKPIFRFNLMDLTSNHISHDSPKMPTFYMILYARNAKGQSDKYIFENIAFKDAEKRINGISTKLKNMVPLVAMFGGIVITLLLSMFFILMFSIKKRRTTHSSSSINNNNRISSNSRFLLENNCKEQETAKLSPNNSRGSILEVNSCDNQYVVAYTLKPNGHRKNQIKQSPDILHTPKAPVSTKSASSTPISQKNINFQLSKENGIISNFEKTSSLDRSRINHYLNNNNINSNNNSAVNEQVNMHYGTIRKDQYQQAFTDTIPGPESCV